MQLSYEVILLIFPPLNVLVGSRVIRVGLFAYLKLSCPSWDANNESNL